MKKRLIVFIYFALLVSNLQAYQHFTNVDDAIEALIPENEIENNVISSPEWIEGAKWGFPRKGHPEGAIIYHIFEVLGNVEKYYATSPLRENLRIITIIHDTFKYKVNLSLPSKGENQHGMIARRFAENHLSDPMLLEIIQRHDDAYFAWKIGAEQGDWDKAYQKAQELIDILGDHLELFVAFYECDNNTGDKTTEPIEWFKEFARYSQMQIN